jgi:hypothetical protein
LFEGRGEDYQQFGFNSKGMPHQMPTIGIFNNVSLSDQQRIAKREKSKQHAKEMRQRLKDGPKEDF